MSYTQAIARVSEIQGQIASLRTAFDPPAAKAAAATPPSSGGASLTGRSGSFANALTQAQAPPQAQNIGGAPGATALTSTAQGLLTTGQQQFASRLAADTGLSAQVVAAWLLAEESGGAANTRQSANNNDWLNIGYTDSATYGAADSVWSSPVTAADATAGWLRGQNTIPGYGTASAGIRAILGTAGQSPAAQIAAIQQSGWASSGYPDLPALYQQVA